MANLAVLASGSGSNFEAIARKLIDSGRHRIVCLICDRKNAYAFKRAEKLDIPARYVTWYKRNPEEAERDVEAILSDFDTDLTALAGFMRILTPWIIDRRPIINIHPALLPKYPGAHGIKESYNSNDRELGITIHRVDYGMDTGQVIHQASFKREGSESLDEIESKIHRLEHRYYPEILIDLLDNLK